MKKALIIAALAGAPLMWTAGCVVEHDRVVERRGEPVYHEVYVEGRAAPELRVEVVPERPHPRAEWIQGRWVHEGPNWVWHRGYWR